MNNKETIRRSGIFVALLVIAGGTATVDAAEENDKTIRLICTYSYTIDEKGEKSGTSGEELFTVLPLRDGQVAVRKQGLGAPFSGKMSEEEIVADVNYEISNVKFAESLIINRFTGEFQLSFGAPGKPGLIHFGKCRPVTKQLF
jgi:hypothetical protein